MSCFDCAKTVGLADGCLWSCKRRKCIAKVVRMLADYQMIDLDELDFVSLTRSYCAR